MHLVRSRGNGFAKIPALAMTEVSIGEVTGLAIRESSTRDHGRSVLRQSGLPKQGLDRDATRTFVGKCSVRQHARLISIRSRSADELISISWPSNCSTGKRRWS
jgi:hypothetical protein